MKTHLTIASMEVKAQSSEFPSACLDEGGNLLLLLDGGIFLRVFLIQIRQLVLNCYSSCATVNFVTLVHRHSWLSDTARI
jgi:hypothetical protein